MAKPLTTPAYPAPWALRGNGYTQLLTASPEWILANGFIPNQLLNRYIPGSQALVMWVDYHDSDVGPYRELLFIPGRFRFDENGFKGSRYTITKIYVSTLASVENGQRNWGIPKELADFDIEPLGPRSERIRVSKGGDLIAQADFTYRRLGLPVSTRFMPSNIGSVAQYRDRDLVITAPRARGRSHLASASNAQFNAELFPNIADDAIRQSLCLANRHIAMTFPVPRVFAPNQD